MVLQRIQHSTLLSGWPWSQFSPQVPFVGPGEGSQGIWSHFSPAPTGTCGASGLGCGTRSPWGFIPHPHMGISTAELSGQCQAGSAMTPWAHLTEGALDMAQGTFSCVPQPWPSLRAITLSSRLRNTLLSLLFLHSYSFSLGLAIADVAVQAPNSKCQSKGIGFSASQPVSTDP